jgi:hypothetical protein
MIAAFLSGVFLIAVGAVVDEPEILHEIVRDLGIAVVISVLVFVFIEYHNHRRREKETEQDVVSGILADMLGPEVWTQVKTAIIPDGIICERWELDASISREPVIVTDSAGRKVEEVHFVSRAVLRYTLRNYREREAPILLRHELESDIRGTTTAGNPLPCIKRLHIKPSALKPPSEDLNTADLDKQGCLRGGGYFEMPVTLSPESTLEVTLEREEAISGQFPWYMFWVTLRPRVVVHSVPGSGLVFGLRLRHPLGRDVDPARTDPSEWQLPAAFLQGQGFAIMTTGAATAI